MTPAELEAIRARANAATEGPWRAVHNPGECTWIESKHGDGIASIVFWRDIPFLQHARTDVPALLDEVERLGSYYKGLLEEHDVLSVSNVALRDEVARLTRANAEWEAANKKFVAERYALDAEVERLREDSSNLTAIAELLKADGRPAEHRYALPGAVQLLLGEIDDAERRYQEVGGFWAEAADEVERLRKECDTFRRDFDSVVADRNFHSDCLRDTDEALETAEAERDEMSAALDEALHDLDQSEFYFSEVEKENRSLRIQLDACRIRLDWTVK